MNSVHPPYYPQSFWCTNKLNFLARGVIAHEHTLYSYNIRTCVIVWKLKVFFDNLFDFEKKLKSVLLKQPQTRMLDGWDVCLYTTSLLPMLINK